MPTKKICHSAVKTVDIRFSNSQKKGRRPGEPPGEKTSWVNRYGIETGDALRIARELIERADEEGLNGVRLLNHCRDIINLGDKAYRESQSSVSFCEATRASLNERAERRQRTVCELRRFARVMIGKSPDLADKRLRDFTPQDCLALLKASFTTPHQYAKGRAILHSIFACGVRRGWCAYNPVDAVQRPELQESEVEPLPWEQLRLLLRTAQRPEHSPCMPALGIMLWAGVRPAEMMRLSWADLDWEEKVISLRARHSKTGGSRHITLHPVLVNWLLSYASPPPTAGRICPRDWIHRWSRLRRDAGIIHWRPDVLRHTFASYHIKRWHNPALLQDEMGHRSARLLRTRYLSMHGITRSHAQLFWSPEMIRRHEK